MENCANHVNCPAPQPCKYRRWHSVSDCELAKPLVCGHPTYCLTTDINVGADASGTTFCGACRREQLLAQEAAQALDDFNREEQRRREREQADQEEREREACIRREADQRERAAFIRRGGEAGRLL